MRSCFFCPRISYTVDALDGDRFKVEYAFNDIVIEADSRSLLVSPTFSVRPYTMRFDLRLRFSRSSTRFSNPLVCCPDFIHTAFELLFKIGNPIQFFVDVD